MRSFSDRDLFLSRKVYLRPFYHVSRKKVIFNCDHNFITPLLRTSHRQPTKNKECYPPPRNRCWEPVTDSLQRMLPPPPTKSLLRTSHRQPSKNVTLPLSKCEPLVTIIKHRGFFCFVLHTVWNHFLLFSKPVKLEKPDLRNNKYVRNRCAVISHPCCELYTQYNNTIHF